MISEGKSIMREGLRVLEIDKVKVFKMNDYSWFASKFDMEKTNEYYNQEIDDNDIEDVEECDLDKDGMWWETTDKADIEKLGEADELVDDIGKTSVGDLMRRDSQVYKFTSFRKVLEESNDFTEPYEIATTEW
jgi:hypothetical protein